MGWCSAGTSGEECDARTCSEIGADYSENRPTGCLVLSILEDPHARAVIRSMIYPPILSVRDHILPQSRTGRRIVEDFNRHYDEAVSILRANPDLLAEVVSYLTASVPFARALAGEHLTTPPVSRGHTPSSYTSERLRSGMLDWTSQVLDRFRAAAQPELAATVERYQRLLPGLEGLSPREFLTELRKPDLLEMLASPARQ